MHLKLFLIFIIALVGGSIMLLTGTLVPFLLVVKGFIVFILQLCLLLFVIWLGGQLILFVLMKFEAIRAERRRKKKLRLRQGQR